MDSDEFKAIIGIDKPGQDQPLIFFCVKGIRAKRAADIVQEQFKYNQSCFYPGSFMDLKD